MPADAPVITVTGRNAVMPIIDFLRNLVPEFTDGGKQPEPPKSGLVALPVTRRYGIMPPGHGKTTPKNGEQRKTWENTTGERADCGDKLSSLARAAAGRDCAAHPRQRSRQALRLARGFPRYRLRRRRARDRRHCRPVRLRQDHTAALH